MQIDSELTQLLSVIEQNGGELTEDHERQLGELLNQSKSKVSSYCAVLDKMQNEIDYVNLRIKEAKEYIDNIEKQKDRLEKIALVVMNNRGEKLEGEDGRWIGKRKSKKLVVTDESKIDHFYLKITPSVDRALLKEAILNGEYCEGAHVEENESVNWK